MFAVVAKVRLLYLITKLQNLKAIHNSETIEEYMNTVVSNYKITKSESYSQRCLRKCNEAESCI